jgi:hypothetical protein
MKTTNTTCCSCGTHEPHEVARRRTLDGKLVALWSDGLVTGQMGWGIRGVGSARSAFERARDLRAGWLAIEEVGLYDYAEVGALVRAVRRAVRQDSLDPLYYTRRVLAGARFRRCGRHGAVIKEVP